VVLIRAEVRELLQRTERLIDLAALLHPVGVLEEVDLRIADEPLASADLPELVVDGRPTRRVTQDLVAERDGVVEEAAVGITVDRLLVVVHGIGDVALLEVEVADTVIETDVDVLVGVAEAV